MSEEPPKNNDGNGRSEFRDNLIELPRTEEGAVDVANLKVAQSIAGGGDGPPIDPPGRFSYGSSMDLPERVTRVEGRLDKVEQRLDGVEARLGRVEQAVSELKALMDGFKESLRAMQWSLGIILGLGLAFLGLLITIGNARLSEISVRMDRFLERQADTAAAANARFDRLLEQRASTPPQPVIIQVPTITPSPIAPTP